MKKIQDRRLDIKRYIRGFSNVNQKEVTQNTSSGSTLKKPCENNKVQSDLSVTTKQLRDNPLLQDDVKKLLSALGVEEGKEEDEEQLPSQDYGAVGGKLKSGRLAKPHESVKM